MKLGEIKIDAARVEEGAWVENIPEMGDLRLKVRGLNNATYRRVMSKLVEAVPRNKRVGGRVDPDEQDRIMSICLRDCCLLDWAGLQDESGVDLPYSKEMANTLLTQPEYRRFREAVAWAAGVVGEQQAEVQEDALGN